MSLWTQRAWPTPAASPVRQPAPNFRNLFPAVIRFGRDETRTCMQGPSRARSCWPSARPPRRSSPRKRSCRPAAPPGKL